MWYVEVDLVSVILENNEFVYFLISWDMPTLEELANKNIKYIVFWLLIIDNSYMYFNNIEH